MQRRSSACLTTPPAWLRRFGKYKNIHVAKNLTNSMSALAAENPRRSNNKSTVSGTPSG